MKINEVEALAGITKKNIRFYEEQGLLSPSRNAENGYRDYGEEEVRRLQRIKLLRKLGVPIEEIRRMFDGTHTVADGMRRHLISLEREQRNLEQSVALCRQLQSLEIPASELQAEQILLEIEQLERGGTMFQDKQKLDVRVRYVAPVIVTIIMVALILGLCALMFWTYRIDPDAAPPFWLLLLSVGILLCVGVGVVLALGQRIREIGRREIDDAKRY